MTAIWHKAYPTGVPAAIEPEQYSSLVALTTEAIRRFGDRPAFSSFGTVLTYRDLDRRATAFAAYLQRRLHIKPGDRVALMLPNLLQYPVALLGVLRCGAIVVNTNPLYTARELKHQLCDAEARAIVIFEPMLPTLAEIASETSLRAVIATSAGDLFPTVKRLVSNLKTRSPSIPRPRVIPFAQTLTRGAALAFSPPTIQPEDLAFLQYTGGTTGTAKGAMLTHRNMVANVQQAYAWTRALATPGEEVVVTALPLYHIFALTMNCFTFMLHGGLNLLIADPRNIRRLVHELKRTPVTVFNGVNTLFNALLQDQEFVGLDFSTWRFVGGGGAAVQRSVAETWQKITGTTIVEGYGLTEASPLVCLNPPALNEFTGCIGLPVPSTECRVVDEQDHDVPPDTPGELWVRGPQVMRGYWRKPVETSAVLTPEGWLKTGDVVVMRGDGYFKIIDRKKDLIIVSGFNVYPNEIEEVVAIHPGVRECAAIGIADVRTGEAIRLVVVRRDPVLTESELLAHCRQLLTNYKIPKQIVFVAELPKSNVGKILRRQVRQTFSP
jgi:long-chain acyl-CoA synthetase